MIKTTVKHDDVLTHTTPCLVVFCPEEAKPGKVLKQIDTKLHGAVTAAFKDKRFEGKPQQTLWLNAMGALGANHVLLAGVGTLKKLNAEIVRQAAGCAAKRAEQARATKVSFYVEDATVGKAFGSAKNQGPAAGAVTEGSLLALYHFDHYKSEKDGDDAPSRIAEITLLCDGKAQVNAGKTAVDKARTLAEAVCLTRDLILHPSNRATPSFLAQNAKKIAKAAKVTCKVLGEKEMKKLGMGSFLGVSKGSHEPPAFIILEYAGGKKSDPPVVIVGKAVTFDTGGISLKPPANMDEMKMDMSGGAVTLGTIQAAAGLKLPINVVGLVPATENMPGGSATKPGDILTSMSGKTIEVLNTDAEGRLILADALTYAARYKPRALIDLATLTGAVIMALGHYAAAVMGNDDDLIEKLTESGEETGERVWRLPLWDEHDKAVKGNIADLKNIAAPGVGAGTTMGAAFLKPFAGEGPWTHIDIAGTSWSGEDKPYTPKGASGFGVRLLTHFLEREAHAAKPKRRSARKK